MAKNASEWLGGEVIAWGGGVQQVDSWGQPIPQIRVVDPGTPLSDLSLGLSRAPRQMWRAQPSLRKVISFAARNIAAVPLHVFTRVSDTDRVRDAQGAAESLLRDPAPLMTGPALLHDLVVDWMLYDRYLLILVDGHLRRVPAGLIDVKTDFLGGITALRVNTTGGYVDVTDLVLAYDAGWSGDTGGGESPLVTLGPLLEEQKSAISWRRQQWQQSAKITGILTNDKQLHQAVKDRLSEGWRTFVAHGGTPILDGGTKFEPMNGVKPVETQDLEGRKLSDSEVASFYHIPPELVGARETTFSNVKAFREMLYGPVLGPIMQRIEASLNARLIPALAPPGSYAEFAREAAMAGSFIEQAQVLSRAVGGPHMTRAEARARQNLPHLDGTDELITPMNVTTGGLASPADTAQGGDPYAPEKQGDEA